MDVNKPKLIIILGSTASGKSNLAVRLAKKFNGEIVSADSRQVYKRLDIGTGKITRKEMSGILHHLLDVISPQKQFSVFDYHHLANQAIVKIVKKKKIPFVVGGSGMYIDAILYGAPYPPVPPNSKFREYLEKKSAEDLFHMLQKKDPARARNIDRYNKRRLIRALEIISYLKKPIPQLIKTPQYRTLLLGIKMSKKELEKKISYRLQNRFRRGMIREVKNLLKRGVSYRRLYALGLEYRFIGAFLKRAYSKKEMEKKLFQAIKQYAKRQTTWFSNQYKNIQWITKPKEAEQKIRIFLAHP